MNRLFSGLAGIGLLASLAVAATAPPRTFNGFVIDDPLVPAQEILPGGPPRDGIPALTLPPTTTSGEADWLAPRDRVLGFEHGGEARAYPVRLLNYHEIVNDRVGGEPVLITFCPLCGTGMGFRPVVNGKPLEFGVSGLLYNSDLLMYDRATESLWSQIEGRAINGPMKGTRLERLFITHTTWGQWREAHPGTRVLALDTGYWRDYTRSPYGSYEESENLYFPVSHLDRRFHPKDVVLGVEWQGKALAFPLRTLARTGRSRLTYTWHGQTFEVLHDVEARTAEVRLPDGTRPDQMLVYWFAWAAFHPDTDVYAAP
ncbi:DUF3179 domain-containing protein [Hahella sp. SMD15-11]|uniref:DUF3179 domain-containing protein n=1 Tax=Thermohahella caldifontis TaxID=3142973 RepID=A0AB39UV35_9GAMM